MPAAGIFVATMVGLALACGGASALNHYLDRDIDKLMGSRTATRPVASGRVPAERALEFGIALTAASFVLLDSLVNFPTAALALAGGLFYVFVYTRLLKRSTPQNIVIGGAAGAVPPLVGYASATGHLGWAALVMFGIVFLWTPPHFWALALMIKEHYANARVPMLPVVRGDRETARQIVLYSAVLVVGTLVPVAFGIFGLAYGVSAAVLGALLLWWSIELWRDTTPPARGAALPLLDAVPRAALRRDGARRHALVVRADPHADELLRRAVHVEVEDETAAVRHAARRRVVLDHPDRGLRRIDLVAALGADHRARRSRANHNRHRDQSRSRSSCFFSSNSAAVMRPRSRMSARRVIEASTSSAVSRVAPRAPPPAPRRGRRSRAAADLELVLVLRVEQRPLEAVRVGQEADLVRARPRTP